MRWLNAPFYVHGDASWKYDIHTHPTQIDCLISTVAIRTTFELFVRQLSRIHLVEVISFDETPNIKPSLFFYSCFQSTKTKAQCFKEKGLYGTSHLEPIFHLENDCESVMN
jgi:hypothetical protein